MSVYELQAIAETFGDAKRSGSGWVCSCPAHNDRKPSLSLSMCGDKLLVHCFAGCDPEEILSAVRNVSFTGNIESNESFLAEQTIERKKEYAQKIWNASQPAEGTPVKTYLQARGFSGRMPNRIRYYPRLKHFPSGQFLPAMVAAVTIYPSSEIVAVHRTYLKQDGSGKADLEPNKMMLGSVKGGAVMFGPQQGDHLYIAEGIETALSIFLVTGQATWAALSTSNMQHVVLPDVKQVPHLCIAADWDSAGLLAAVNLQDREELLGRRAAIALPKTPGLDFNDLLRG